MIQATCTCGWTMAGPPADSWAIDEAVDEHSLWCPDSQDWANEAIDGQQIERDRIIGRIRETFSSEHADYIVDVITRNTTNGTGNPAKSSPDAAPNPNPQEEDRAMSDATESTAWHPIWCVDCFNNAPTEMHHQGEPITYTRPYSREYGDISLTARLQLWEWLDEADEQHPTVQVTLNDGDALDLTGHDLDQVINVLATARQRLIATGEV